MKDYYEILEVNPKASSEVIEKAYRVLVKKYHPDMYKEERQQYAQKKIQEINEAYKVLSDEFLREQYDNELKKQEIKNRQNIYQTQKEEKRKRNDNRTENRIQNRTENEKKQRTGTQQVGTLGSMIELVKELGHNLSKSKEAKEKRGPITKQDVIAVVLTIIVVLLIGVILWFIPFTNGWMREFLFENPIANWIRR